MTALIEEETSAYRCKVQAGDDHAILRLRRRKLEIRVLEISRDDFVIEANDLQLPLYKTDTKGRIWFHRDIWDIAVVGVIERNDGRHRVILSRTRDRTPAPKLKTSLFNFAPMNSLGSDPLLPAAIIIAFLVSLFALPGVGDSLGTAPRIRSTIGQFIPSFLPKPNVRPTQPR